MEYLVDGGSFINEASSFSILSFYFINRYLVPNLVNYLWLKVSLVYKYNEQYEYHYNILIMINGNYVCSDWSCVMQTCLRLSLKTIQLDKKALQHNSVQKSFVSYLEFKPHIKLITGFPWIIFFLHRKRHCEGIKILCRTILEIITLMNMSDAVSGET